MTMVSRGRRREAAMVVTAQCRFILFTGLAYAGTRRHPFCRAGKFGSRTSGGRTRSYLWDLLTSRPYLS
jgi:hypothetical protein